MGPGQKIEGRWRQGGSGQGEQSRGTALRQARSLLMEKRAAAGGRRSWARGRGSDTGASGTGRKPWKQDARLSPTCKPAGMKTQRSRASRGLNSPGGWSLTRMRRLTWSRSALVTRSTLFSKIRSANATCFSVCVCGWVGGWVGLGGVRAGVGPVACGISTAVLAALMQRLHLPIVYLNPVCPTHPPH
jgi:hypothetical protein